MFAGTQQTEEQQELKTCEVKSQDATKITSACADSCIQFPRMLCVCLALKNMLLGVAPHSSSFVTIAALRPHCVEKSDRWTLDDVSHSLDTASNWSSMRKHAATKGYQGAKTCRH